MIDYYSFTWKKHGVIAMVDMGDLFKEQKVQEKRKKEKQRKFVAQNRESQEKDELWKKLPFEAQNSPLKDLWQILSLKDAQNAFHIISRPSFSHGEKTPYDILKNILLEKYLMPCLDDVAKSIFLDDDPDFPLLRDLLNALLYDGKEVIVSLEVGLSEFPKKYKFEKRTIFDIRATLDTGDRVHIEFQVLVKKSLKQRVLFYWAKHFTQGIEEGDDYALLAPTVSVWILEEFFSSHPTAFSQYAVLERSTLKKYFKGRISSFKDLFIRIFKAFRRRCERKVESLAKVFFDKNRRGY